MPSLDRDGDVFVLNLGNEDGSNQENRFHPDWIDAVHGLLDTVEAIEGPAALVTTAPGKFFTNGLDTDYLFSHMDSMASYLDKVHALYARVLTFPMATVAAVQGHAFGAGAMFALAHDVQFMRIDRGFFCLPEVSLGMPFTPGMSTLLSSRLTARTALEAMTTGRRYGGADALAAGIVEATFGEAELLPAALARAATVTSTHGPNLSTIKRSIHGATLSALARPMAETDFSFGG